MTRTGVRRLVYGGTATAGFPVGVIILDTRHALLPGNAQHASSFDTPILYGTVPFGDDPEALMRGDPGLMESILESARHLEAQGVRAIAGACGSFGYYQKGVAAAVNVPVFMSIMLQVPLLQTSIGVDRKLLIVCAKRSALTPRLFSECGITSTDNLVFRELAGNSEFDRMMCAVDPLNVENLSVEVLDVIARAQEDEPRIAAIVLQCSDLPPLAPDIQDRTGLPVFDAVLMIRWIAMAAQYLPYHGPVRLQRRFS